MTFGKRLLSLFLLAVACAAIWRIELELRWGWKSLGWIYTAFHYSAAIIPAVCSIWLFFFSPCSRPKHRWLHSVFTFFGGVAAYFIFANVFALLYSPFYFPDPPIVALLIVLLTSIPLGICLVAWLMTDSFSHIFWIVTPLMLFISLYLAYALLWITDHPGGVDTVHTVKSGFIFIGFTISGGLPFIFPREKRAYARA